MTLTGLRRKLLVSFLAVSSILGFYTLCMSLEIQVPWHTMVTARFTGARRNDKPSSNSSQASLPLSTHVFKLSTEPQPERSSNALTTVLTAQNTPNGTLLHQEHITAIATTAARHTSPRITVETTNATQDPPYIGDSYAKEEDTMLPQTECSDRIRIKVAQTDFREKFLGNIPVLQWEKHATEEQYKRLQQYPGTHGWKWLDFQTIQTSLSALNTDANTRMFDDWALRANGSNCVRCAVVGNGGILRGSKKGKEIDQHDYVFRTNGAVTKGFEEDVGTRTTHYTFSTNTMRNSMASYRDQGYSGPPQSEETRYVFLPDQDRDYLLIKAAALNTTVERGPEKNQKASVYFGKNVSVHNIKMYHPDFVRYIRNRFLRSQTLTTKYKDIYRPSTGAVMLLAALHTCDKVSAYGFMTPNYSKYSDHYFNKKFQPVGFYINHDLRMELNLWQQLHKAGLLQLYMRP